MRGSWVAAYGAVLAAGAAFLCWQGFALALLPGLLAVSLLAVVFLAVTGAGRIALQAFGVRDLSSSEKTLIGATLGLGVLSQAVLVLGLFGGLKPWAAAGLLGLLWVVGFTEIGEVLRSLAGSAGLLRDRPLAAGGVCAVLLLLLWAACIPPHQYDSLVYRLPLAAAYAREGRIVDLPHLLQSHLPQNAGMLHTLALLMGSDLLAQMFTWLGAALSVWWLFELGKRELPASALLLACLFTVSHAGVMLSAPTTAPEPLVMLWTTASVLSFLRWRECSHPEDHPRGWLALSGIFAGLGVGTDYHAAITPVLLGGWLCAESLLRLRRPSERRRRGLDALAFCGAAALSGAPWLVRNALLVGDPVFPYFHRWFTLKGVDWSPQSAGRYCELMAAHAPGAFSGRGAGGWWPLLAALPVGLWALRRNRYLLWTALYGAAHLALWRVSGAPAGMLVALAPLAALLAANGLFRAWEGAGPWGRGLLAAGTAGLFVLNLGLFLRAHAVMDSLPVLTGAQSRRDYLSERLDYHPCAVFLRESVPAGEKVLVVGEQRGYHIVQPQTTTTVLAPNRFVRLANAAADPADLSARLRAEGYRHLLVVPREADRLGEGYGVFHFTEGGFGRWSALEDGWLDRIFEAPGRCAVYRLRTP